MGSVKDLITIDNAKTAKLVFSDRYSVFDWGTMPDEIKDKGKALCIIAACFFEKIEQSGIATHYAGLQHDGQLKSLSELSEAVAVMRIKLVDNLSVKYKDGTYDYSQYCLQKENFRIPLEIIYRNTLPVGSSVFKRLKSNQLNLENLGLEHIPEPGYILETPYVEASTKQESFDRYITWKEAARLVSLTPSDIDEIKHSSLQINDIITNASKEVGLINHDGKMEFAYDNKRKLVLADAVGTPDESRFSYAGTAISKELMRSYYRKTEWFRSVENAKKTGVPNWKDRVSIVPPGLPQQWQLILSKLYRSFCNHITQKTWFKEDKFEDVVEQVDRLLLEKGV